MQYALVRLVEWSHTQGSNNLYSRMIENDEIDELSCPDDLIKYIRPPCHDMDKAGESLIRSFNASDSY